MLTSRQEYIRLVQAMSLKESSPYSNHRRLFGWMASHEVPELYRTLNRPARRSLPSVVVEYGSTSKDSPVRTELHLPSSSHALEVLEITMGDISSLTTICRQSKNAQVKKLVSTPSQRTANILGRISQLQNDDVKVYWRDRELLAAEGGLSMKALLADPYEVTQSRPILPTDGCPFGKDGLFRENMRDPLFDKFVLWAVGLDTEAHNYHTLRED